KGMADRKFEITLQTPTWKDTTAANIRMIVQSNNGERRDEVHTDEGNLWRFTGRERIIDIAAEALQLSDGEKELFREQFLTQWHQLAIEVTKSKNLGPAQVNAQMLLQDMDPAVKQAAEVMLRSPALMEKIADDAEGLGIVGERTMVQQLYVINT